MYIFKHNYFPAKHTQVGFNTYTHVIMYFQVQQLSVM